LILLALLPTAWGLLALGSASDGDVSDFATLVALSLPESASLGVMRLPTAIAWASYPMNAMVGAFHLFGSSFCRFHGLCNL